MPRKSESQDELVLHAGVLFKRGSGRLFGRKNWKTRHFELTHTKLRYFTFENGKLRDEIDLTNCTREALEIMPANARKTGRSASSIWRFQLNVPSGRCLLMAAPTEREMNIWIHWMSQVLKTPLIATPSQSAIPVLAEEDTRVTTHDASSSVRGYLRHTSTPILQELENQPTSDRPLTSDWNTKSNDFQNFVSHHRRPVVSGHHSREGCSISSSVDRRHSTGGPVGCMLQEELEELRGGVVGDGTAPSDADTAELEDDGTTLVFKDESPAVKPILHDAKDGLTLLIAEHAELTKQPSFSAGSTLLASDISALEVDRTREIEREDDLIQGLLFGNSSTPVEKQWPDEQEPESHCAVATNITGAGKNANREAIRSSLARTKTMSSSSSSRRPSLTDEEEANSPLARYSQARNSRSDWSDTDADIDYTLWDPRDTQVMDVTSPCPATAQVLEFNDDDSPELVAQSPRKSLDVDEERSSFLQRWSFQMRKRQTSVDL